jgi:hypothetical protein
MNYNLFNFNLVYKFKYSAIKYIYIFNLGSYLLSITIDDEMMKEHLEINLHSNENIE